MSKKLIVACMVIAAFAVVPSLASAKPVITHPTGSVLATETKILATNVGGPTIMTLTGGGKIECSSAKLTGTLKTNSTASGFEGEIESATFTGTGGTQASEPGLPECTGTFLSAVTVTGLPWCLEGTEANDNFKLRGGKCSEAAKALNFTLSSTIFGFPVVCKYQRGAASPVTGHFTTHPAGDLVGTVTGEPEFLRVESSETCPTGGSLDMSFTAETDTTASADPLYASE
jgi:hypothetical protein